MKKLKYAAVAAGLIVAVAGGTLYARTMFCETCTCDFNTGECACENCVYT